MANGSAGFIGSNGSNGSGGGSKGVLGSEDPPFQSVFYSKVNVSINYYTSTV